MLFVDGNFFRGQQVGIIFLGNYSKIEVGQVES